jgi:DNA-directed RNA polymerase subunit M/transcription elongation factor TFIIS
MDVIAAQTPAIQALWASVPEPLQMDVLDILRSDLADDVKQAATTRATTSTDQEDFIQHNPLIKEFRVAAETAAESLLYKVEVSNLNFECKFCKSKKTRVISSQTRSADEATPVRIVCLACGKSSME